MSLTTAVRSLRRTTKKRFPGSSDQDVAVFLGHVYQAAAANAGSTSYKDEDAIAAADEKLAEAAEAYEEWAVNLRDAVLVNIVKPIVDKATEKGVDPVTALLLEDFGTEEARAHVAALQARDADQAPVATDEADGDADGDDSDDPGYTLAGATDAATPSY